MMMFQKTAHAVVQYENLLKPVAKSLYSRLWIAHKAFKSTSTSLMVILLWSMVAPVYASFDCEEWCGEEAPNVYFLRPLNDSRANLTLILEDLHALSFNVESIPFHYAVFANNTSSQNPEENEGAQELIESALNLGLNKIEVEQALDRSQAVPEGRCVSNTPQTILQFWRMLHDARDIPATDKQILAQERLRLLGFCEQAANLLPTLEVSSESAKPYADYLRAAAYFYAGKFDELVKAVEPSPVPESWFKRALNSVMEWFEQLLKRFRSPTPTETKPPSMTSLNALSASPQVWVKETAIYLLGRVYLNQAQQDFQLYSQESKPDSHLLTKANDQFKAYLAEYPKGLYAESARGLSRKIDWLGNNYVAQTQAYNAQLAGYRQQAPKSSELLMFIDELERKYPFNHLAEGSAWDSPVLASVGALMAMRSAPDHAANAKAIESYLSTVLQAHKERFVQDGLVAVYDYLTLAYRFYTERDFAKVIQLTDTQTTGDNLSNTEFSSLVLRGLALGAQGQWDKAEYLWLDLFSRSQKTGQQIQLQWLLAMTWEQEQRLDKVYAADSPVKSSKIHDFFIASASPALLERVLGRQQLKPLTRTLAYNTLLENLLIRRDYGELLRIAKRFPVAQFESSENHTARDFSSSLKKNEYPCPNFLEVMGGLLKDSKSPVLLNCYGDLIAQLDPAFEWRIGEESVLASHTLEFYYPGQTGLKIEADGFKSKTYTSMDLYLEVIDLPQVKDDARAYALHRALNCHASSGNNHCGSQVIALERRAAWFNLLKSVYKDTIWAKQQKYYW